ncbi:MAG: SpoIID/LytB domain-containing protein [Planctomycetes bacterium]|nr:SpoIID/LytB domain-containing protein [Planctomycetota bacterium]
MRTPRLRSLAVGAALAVVLALVACAAAGPRAAFLPTAAATEPRAGVEIRVALVEWAAVATFDLDGPYWISRLTDDQPLTRDLDGRKTEVKASDKGFDVGGVLLAEKEIRLHPRAPARLKHAGIRYEGTFHLVRNNKNRLLLVNQVDLDAYTRGVIGAEIGASSARAALAAQAVAARTYALARMEDEHRTRKLKYFDVYPDERSQVYKGMANVSPNVSKAVEETQGLVLQFRGKIFTAYFHSTCGGATDSAHDVFGDADIPPLAGVKDPWCDRATLADWSAKFTPKEMEDRLRKEEADLGELRDLKILDARPSGRVLKVGLVHVKSGSERTTKMSGAAFRLALDGDRVKSTWFTIERRDGKWVLSGHGWGHGVGMCQSGAQRMGQKGMDFAAILRFYYPQGELAKGYVPALEGK